MRKVSVVLTQREDQILVKIAAGNTTKEIASLLGLSPWTVADHRKNLCRKLGASSTAELVRLAISRQWESIEGKTGGTAIPERA